MNKEKLLKLLKEGEVEKGINLLEDAIMLDNIKPLSTKAREKKVQNHFKKLEKGSKPILSKYKMIDGKQVFTDSFIAFSLVDDDFISCLKEVTSEESDRYPSILPIMNVEKKACCNIEYNKLIEKVKLANLKDGLISFKFDDEQEAIFKSKLLEIYLLAMNYNKDDSIEFYYNGKSNKNGYVVGIIKSVKENGSSGIILGTRIDNKDDETINEEVIYYND